MNIGDPVEKVPELTRRASYGPLYAAIEAADGQWVPTEFTDRQSTGRAFQAVRAKGYEVRRRALMLYVRRRDGRREGA